MSSVNEPTITMTPTELEKLKREISETATASAISSAYTGAAMVLDNLVTVFSGMTVDTSNAAARQGAEVAVRKMIQVTSQWAEQMRQLARNPPIDEDVAD
jgi:hypothetical protein